MAELRNRLYIFEGKKALGSWVGATLLLAVFGRRVLHEGCGQVGEDRAGATYLACELYGERRKGCEMGALSTLTARISKRQNFQKEGQESTGVGAGVSGESGRERRLRPTKWKPTWKQGLVHRLVAEVYGVSYSGLSSIPKHGKTWRDKEAGSHDRAPSVPETLH